MRRSVGAEARPGPPRFGRFALLAALIVPLGAWRPAPTQRRNYNSVVNSRVRFSRKIRLSKETYADKSLRFHITVRTHPEIGPVSRPIRDAIWASVMEQREANRIQLLAACLMPDHLHLLAGPEELDIITFMDRWK